jgi:hypothetical protein
MTTDSVTIPPWNFWRLCKSLWDWRAWQRTGAFDEVSGYGGRFFLAEGCIVLRDANGSTELYSPPGAQWLVTSLLAYRMARKMKASAQARPLGGVPTALGANDKAQGGRLARPD